MPRPLQTIFKFVFFLAIGLFFVWLSIKDFDARQRAEILSYIASANYWLIVPISVLLVISNVLRAARWRLLIRPLHYHPRLFNVFAAVMIGYLTNLAIPRAGEISRCGVLARYEKIPVDKLIGTMIAERAVDVLTLVVLLLFSVIIQLDIVGDFFFHQFLRRQGTAAGKPYHLWVLVAAVILLAAGVWVMIRYFSHLRVYRKIRIAVIRIGRGFRTVLHMRGNIWFFVYTLLMWAVYLLMVKIGFYGLVETQQLGAKAALAVLTFGSVGMLMPTQGGIGPYQLIVEKILTLFSVPVKISVAMSWLLWIAQMGLYLVIGFIVLLILPIINPTRHDSAKV
ncbi:MAG: flippase-like domain-containing protein [Thermoflavifilum sp.]|nr:flippase-like domain-containing protein [Thermoflavifilum sp.]